MSDIDTADVEDGDCVCLTVEETTNRTPLQDLTDMVEEDLLHRTVCDAGRWAFGTIMVEVWCLTDKKCHLFRPEGGFWIDPLFHNSDSCEEGCPLCRLVKKDLPDYIPPAKLAIGEGLPGVLWAESHMFDNRIVWRELRSIADDPDQPHNHRLQLIASCVELAAAVPFNSNGREGIVIYSAPVSAKRKKLESLSNDNYLRSAAELIGAAFSIRRALEEAVKSRRQEHASDMRRCMINMNSALVIQEETESLDEQDDVRNTCVTSVKKKALTMRTKLMGGGVKPPPAMNSLESLWTFFGSLFTLLILTRFSQYVEDTYGKENGLVLGPFGALMTLQYALTAAPASQPRNAILGQAVSLLISLCVGYLKDYLDLWLRQAIACAVAIGVMARLGVIHPPAAAAAIKFAKGSNGWTSMGFMIAGNLIAIFCASFINNLNNKRQYPTFYGLSFFTQFCESDHDDDEEEKKKD